MNIVVSAKIPEELKKKADQYGVKIGSLLRESLEKKIKAIEKERLTLKLDEISDKIGSKVRRQDVVRAVRESRDER